MLPLFLALVLAAQDKPPDPCTISGTVVNSVTGEPLNKVDLALEGVGSQFFRAASTTDASGRFTLVDVQPGSYHLTGRRNGYLETAYGARRPDSSGTTLRLDPGQTLADLKLKLMPYAVIAGTVRDSDGEPLADAHVTAGRITYEDGRPHLENYTSVETDDLGQYRIRDLPPGKYYVRAQPPHETWSADHSPDAVRREDTVPTVYPGSADSAGAAPVEVRAGARVTGIDITFVRVRTFRVSGRVLTASGSGVADASVSLRTQGKGGDFDAIGLGTPTRNPQGDFVILGVPSGSYRLTAGSKDNLTATLPVQVGTSGVEGLRVVLGAASTLHFRVTAEGDHKPDTSQLMFMVTTDGRRGYYLDATGKAIFGSYQSIAPDHYQVRVERISAGFYVKSIRAADTDILADGLTVAPGTSLELDIVLASDGGRVEGTVADSSDHASAGATVLLVPDSRTRADLYRTVTADQYGHYEFTAVPPGGYKLFAWDDIEPGIWFDPAFLADRKKEGADVTIRAQQQETVKVRLASSSAP
jgi:protocatechuate 3,4-dioxygenase beta subunit